MLTMYGDFSLATCTSTALVHWIKNSINLRFRPLTFFCQICFVEDNFISCHVSVLIEFCCCFFQVQLSDLLFKFGKWITDLNFCNWFPCWFLVLEVLSFLFESSNFFKELNMLQAVRNHFLNVLSIRNLSESRNDWKNLSQLFLRFVYFFKVL